MDLVKISVAADFSRTPGPRYIDEGKFSGEKFRQEVLFPRVKAALESNSKFEVNLDGTAGYGTSFLEEAFGGLIRIDKLDYEEIVASMKIISTEEDYLVDDINEYLSDANKESKKASS